MDIRGKFIHYRTTGRRPAGVELLAQISVSWKSVMAIRQAGTTRDADGGERWPAAVASLIVGAAFIALWFWFLYFLKKRTVPTNRLLLLGIVLAGPLSFLAIELGWMVTEFGRQPWVIYGYLRTKDAVTTAPWLNISFLIFTLIYVLLAVALTRLLLGVARSPLPKVEMPGTSQQPEKAGV